MTDNQKISRPGYIALLSVLIVSAVAAMTVIILFVTSLSTVFNSGDVGEGMIMEEGMIIEL